MTDILFFKHTPGDGLHYVTNNFRVFPDGSFQYGDTSENCIITMADAVISKHRLGVFVDLWNSIYFTDPISHSDMSYIMASAIPYIDMQKFISLAPDDIEAVLDDLRCIHLDALADRIKELLVQKYVA